MQKYFVITCIGERDMNYWGNGILIIKGEVVVPRKEEIVTKLEID